MKATILLVDDDPIDMVPMKALIESWQHAVLTARSGEQAIGVLEQHPVDAVVSDVFMPGMGGVELMRRTRQAHPDLPVVLVSGRADVRTAVDAVKDGAFDYVVKPPDEEEFRLTLERALEHAHLRRENRFLRAEIAAGGSTGERLIGRSPAMQEVFALIDRVARTDSTVLISGETGTGKEVVAQTLHYRSHRAGGPFVAFNCAAIPATLVESELFGHEKGAFTGAVAARRGRFEEAQGGTVFLDEIAETPGDFQAKLLRVLQEREIRRVGGATSIRVDVRVLASTNRDLAAEVSRGAFRTDLFYRLNVIPLRLPPLRERREDIPLLADHFASRYAAQYGLPPPRLAADTRDALLARPWPGNVRELQHVLERAVVLARGPDLTAADLEMPAAPGGPAESDPHSYDLERHLDDERRAHVRRVLDAAGWNKQRAARWLGIDRTTLHRMIARLRLEDLGPA